MEIKKEGVVVISKSKSFTLIELLVVVAIIAVLVAILLPALNYAREQGRLIGCGANLKEIGILIVMYSNDYNSKLMPGRWDNINGTSGIWGKCFVDAHYIDDWSIWHCPSAYWPIPRTPAFNMPNYTYGMRMHAYYNYQNRVIDLTNLSYDRTPCDYPLVADSAWYLYWLPIPYWSEICSLDGYSQKVDVTRHTERACILYADGHVDAKDKNDLLNDFPPGRYDMDFKSMRLP